jgi:hypothetical protein
MAGYACLRRQYQRSKRDQAWSIWVVEVIEIEYLFIDRSVFGHQSNLTAELTLEELPYSEGSDMVLSAPVLPFQGQHQLP